MRLRAAAFRAGLGAVHGGDGVGHQVLQLQRFHQVGVPDQAAVGNRHVAQLAPDLGDLRHPLAQAFAVAEHRGVGLHGALHFQPQIGHPDAALGMAGAIEPVERGLAGARRQRRLRPVRLEHHRAPVRRGPAEHHQVEQRVGAEPVGAVHRHAGRLAHRHQPRHDRVGLVAGRPQHFGADIGGNAAHVVVHGRQHRDRLARHIHAGEHPRGFADAGQPLVQDLRAQVLQVQHDVFFVGPAAAPGIDLQRHRARDHVAAGEVLGGRGVALHEALALAVGQVAALAARPFGDQAAGREDAGRVELHELHVLARQAGAQHHGVAVAGAGMRRGAGQEGAPVAAGGQHHGLRPEAVDGAVFQVPGDHPAAGAFLVHDQVEGEVFDEELHVVLQRLLIQRVQDGVAGAVGGGAGAHRRRLAVILHVAAERALVDAAVLGAAERHAVVFQLVNRRDGRAAHVFDGVLIAQPVRPFHGVVHVPAPVVLAHVAERGADAALRRDGVAAGGEHLGDAGGGQPGRADAEGGAQPRPAGAHHHHVIGVVDHLVSAAGRFADRVHLGSVR